MTNFHANDNRCFMNLITQVKGNTWSSACFPFEMSFLIGYVMQLLLFEEELTVLLVTAGLWDPFSCNGFLPGVWYHSFY